MSLKNIVLAIAAVAMIPCIFWVIAYRFNIAASFIVCGSVLGLIYIVYKFLEETDLRLATTQEDQG